MTPNQNPKGKSNTSKLAVHGQALVNWYDKSGMGASARSLVAYLCEIGEVGRISHPLDTGDFMRCEAVLGLAPTLREIFPEMAKADDYWAALVPKWAELQAAPSKTDLIREILKPVQDADPNFFPLGAGASMSITKGATIHPLKADAKKPPMKSTAADVDVEETVYRVAADELRAFIERIERLDAEKKDIADQQKEVMAEAKSRGYDTGVLRKIIALRKRDAHDVSEEEMIMDVYKEALGM